MKSPAGPSARRIALIILPGLDGTDVFFRPFMQQLPSSIDAQVICYPQAGPTGYDELLAHARELVSELSSFYLLGSSFGGPLAIQLAAAEPAKVKGLVLCASFVRAPVRRASVLRFFALAPLVWLLRFARRLPIWIRSDREDPMRVAKSETWSRVPARALAARARAVLGADVRGLLASVGAPVLSIDFSGDAVVPTRSADEICNLQPSAQHIRLSGDHLAVHANPAPVAAEVCRFIEEIESGALKLAPSAA